MIATPQMEPVSTLSRDHKSILAKLRNGPVWLASHSRPTAVIVSVEQWDRIAARLEELQDTVDMLEAELALASGEDLLIDADMEKLKQMADRERIPA